MQCRQCIHIQTINLETWLACLPNLRRLRRRKVLRIRHENRILCLRLPFVVSPNFGNISVHQNSIIVLTGDFPRFSELISFSEAFQNKISPNSSLPTSVDAVGGCTAIDVNLGVQFRHPKFFAAGDDGIGEGFEEQGHVCPAYNGAIFLDVFDTVNVQTQMVVSRVAEPFHRP